VSVLKLQNGITYGPVASRRFGPSLGINLLPTSKKACSFNCVYCHYGWTDLHAGSPGMFAEFFPSVIEVNAAVADAIEEALENRVKINVITFSGNGEPTLHPRFGEVVGNVLLIRDKMLPGVPVQILSNSTTLSAPGVADALSRLDRRIMKLDAGNEELFTLINRPVKGLTLARVVKSLARLKDVTIQAAFMTGGIDNSGDAAVEDWIACLRTIAPLEVQIYSIDRPPADASLRRVPPERLAQIAERVREEGIHATFY
jgi:wyosine [tRNA(Phe)-imidazoG37] synthetase (radical SAM superfamily)